MRASAAAVSGLGAQRDQDGKRPRRPGAEVGDVPTDEGDDGDRPRQGHSEQQRPTPTIAALQRRRP